MPMALIGFGNGPTVPNVIRGVQRLLNVPSRQLSRWRFNLEKETSSLFLPSHHSPAFEYL